MTRKTNLSGNLRGLSGKYKLEDCFDPDATTIKCTMSRYCGASCCSCSFAEAKLTNAGMGQYWDKTLF